MKLRELLFGAALLSLSVVSARAVTVPLPSPLIEEDDVLGSAYYDTLDILGTSNKCSDFFGGSEASVDMFNGLIGRVRKEYFSPSIGIQMSGSTTNVFSLKTQKKYRLFDKVAINRNGPFYRSRHSGSQVSVPRVGRFAPNTKEARVLMFLHELGHVVQKDDGNWLLPNDGGDEGRSRDNTRKIEDVCVDQIKRLADSKLLVNPASRKDRLPDELRTPVNTTP